VTPLGSRSSKQTRLEKCEDLAEVSKMLFTTRISAIRARPMNLSMETLYLLFFSRYKMNSIIVLKKIVS
jgi:hypothetical protein